MKKENLRILKEICLIIFLIMVATIIILWSSNLRYNNENKIDINTIWGKFCQIKNGTFINETNNCIIGNKSTAKRVYWSVCGEDNTKIKWTYYSDIKINLQQPNDVMENCYFAWMDIEK